MTILDHSFKLYSLHSAKHQ